MLLPPKAVNSVQFSQIRSDSGQFDSIQSINCVQSAKLPSTVDLFASSTISTRHLGGELIGHTNPSLFHDTYQRSDIVILDYENSDCVVWNGLSKRCITGVKRVQSQLSRQISIPYTSRGVLRFLCCYYSLFLTLSILHTMQPTSIFRTFTHIEGKNQKKKKAATIDGHDSESVVHL